MILGLDLSLTHTGVVVLDLDGDNPVMVDVIKPKTNKEIRLVEIRDKVNDFVTRCNPTLIVLEGYSFASQGRAVYDIGEMGGVVRVHLYESKRRYMVVPPHSLKKFVTQKGNSPKQIMIREVYRRWKREFDDDNICDAYGLAKVGQAVLALENGTKKMTDFHSYEQISLQSLLKG